MAEHTRRDRPQPGDDKGPTGRRPSSDSRGGRPRRRDDEGRGDRPGSPRRSEGAVGRGERGHGEDMRRGERRRSDGERPDRRPRREGDRDAARAGARAGARDGGARRFGGRDARPAQRDARDRAPQEKPAHNPGDLRAANRPDVGRSPDIDADVTGNELDRGTLKEIGGLEERSASWVAKHLVMAGRYIDDAPELAFQHALAASRKGGRLSRVREAVALTAYAAGEYQDALREFRTYRRMTGDSTHIAAQVDSERALGRHEKALQLAAEVDLERLDRAARVELAMVVSGVREDLGDLQGAHDALQVPELDRRRGYPFSPRLFQRQADVLAALGRTREAAQWQHAVRVAEKALGIGGFADPEIMDVAVLPADDDVRPARRGRGDGSDERTPRRDGREEGRRPRGEISEQQAVAAEGREPSVPAEARDETAVLDRKEDGGVGAADSGETAPTADPESRRSAASESGPVAEEADPNQGSLFDDLAPEEVADAERTVEPAVQGTERPSSEEDDGR